MSEETPHLGIFPVGQLTYFATGFRPNIFQWDDENNDLPYHPIVQQTGEPMRTKVIRKTNCDKDKIKHRYETAFRGKAVQGWQLGNIPSKTYCVRCGAVKR